MVYQYFVADLWLVRFGFNSRTVTASNQQHFAPVNWIFQLPLHLTYDVLSLVYLLYLSFTFKAPIFEVSDGLLEPLYTHIFA